MSAVALTDVSKRFGDTWAMRAVSFVAEPGEFVTLLGPSGCGKTTTLRVIAGFEAPLSGEISIRGQSVAHRPPWKRDIGVVFQSYALFPFLTTFRNVAFGLEMRGYDRADIRRRVEAALAMVGLAGYEDRYPRQMSGGQRQRVALARALVIEPQLLLLDEPLSNLDAKLRAEMRFELKRIQRESGVTTIFVTHDQGEAFSLSDRIVVMNRGEIAQTGSPQEIWQAPNSAFVADFIGVENLLKGRIERMGGRTAVRLDSGAVLMPAARLDSGREDAVVIGIRARDIRLADGSDGEAIRGQVLDSDYRGDAIAYRIRTELGPEPLTVIVPAGRNLAGQVRIELPSDKLIVLRDDLQPPARA